MYFICMAKVLKLLSNTWQPKHSALLATAILLLQQKLQSQRKNYFLTSFHPVAQLTAIILTWRKKST